MLRRREDIQFIEKAAVKMASPQKCFGTCVNIRDLATSRRCLFLHLAMLYCCRVLAEEL